MARRKTLFLSSGELVRDYCKRNKLTYSTVYARIRIIGMTPDEAVQPFYKGDKRLLGSNQKHFIDGVLVRKLWLYDERPHYSYGEFLRRLRTGMTKEEAYFKGEINGR